MIQKKKKGKKRGRNITKCYKILQIRHISRLPALRNYLYLLIILFIVGAAQAGLAYPLAGAGMLPAPKHF
jgi:hypothetical protein